MINTFHFVDTYVTWANETEVPVLVESESCLQDYYIAIDYPGWEVINFWMKKNPSNLLPYTTA
jgi:hypothetical protein